MTASLQPRCILLDTRTIEAAARDASAAGAIDLVEALAVSPPWESMLGRRAVAVRSDPLRLALLGYFSAVDEARINALRTDLDIAQHGFRFVSYAEAEYLTEALAAALLRRLDPAVLTSARYVALPRGGYVVLGMLAYAVGAKARQLEPHEADLWVVADDCAISGLRFMEWLDAHPGPDVVFVHLLSHPELRAALEEHPRVRACLAAEDLTDHAPERLGDGYQEWRTAWLQRDSGVWVGQPDRIAFAWNEPDTAIWNPATERIEPGWHLVGPRRCLKNRRPVPEGAVQVLAHAHGELQPAPDVMWAAFDDEVIIADVSADDVLGLEGAGSFMWLDAISSATEEEAFSKFASRFDVDEELLRQDWAMFIEQLIDRGLLIRA